MDTKAKKKIDVSGKLETIRNHMPTVYCMINERAGKYGNQVFADVRAGLRGEADKFYAFEGLYVVGTRFSNPAIHDDVLKVAPDAKAGAFWFDPLQCSAGACAAAAGAV